MRGVAQKDTTDLTWSPASINVSYSVHVLFSRLNKRQETLVDNIGEVQKALFTSLEPDMAGKYI